MVQTSTALFRLAVMGSAVFDGGSRRRPRRLGGGTGLPLPPDGRRSAATLALVALVAFVSTVDNTVVVAAAPTIGADLGMDLSALQWLGIAYMLPYGGLLLASGALLDRGGDRVLLAGFAVFAAGSALGGTSGTAGGVLAARVVQGVAAALVVPGTLRLVRTALRPGLRAVGATVWTAALATALALGPWLGGALAEHAHWSWIFLGHLPFVVLGGLLVPLASDGRRGPRRHPVPVGNALAATASLFLLTAAVLAATDASAGIGRSLALGVAGCVAGIAFVLGERRAPRPLIPRRLLRERAFSQANGVLLLWGMGTSGVVFATPLVHQEFLGMSPSAASLPLTAVAGAVIVTTPLVPVLSRRWGPGRTVAAGMAVVAAGMGALAAVSHIPEVGPRLVGLVVVGVGSALTTPLTAHALDAVAEDDAGTASGLLTAAREVSGALGIAVTGLVVSLVGASRADEGVPAGPALTHGYTAALVLAAVSQLAGAVLASRMPRPHARSPAGEPTTPPATSTPPASAATSAPPAPSATSEPPGLGR
ncbi:Major Facilitator Superfamily protein [Streptoalloteichus tenebrarius]|uniref:Major Facilitator Superfamily protein n=1 Tax=Streptoalloteichus tenebrarius (strain ATCC 17920 / DSM 40477 / JCM 4838 / CBS 697.72 / NBRC 16177 / NCIMB 11028 / NRRL B-12390 / A12253. 1 / ISP 5477) TaxID=1933 RepID=A0ABT1HLS2_STRSD|nr:MFS transporter [Streptoalloteichus tenebrarius]MCP2256459.1 Major Facilitator Superfamily protein [Streptoalloteichus tenebrarius]BFF04810.1 MFS transporter [Streptoalloteichus tenebrarius]